MDRPSPYRATVRTPPVRPRTPPQARATKAAAHAPSLNQPMVEALNAYLLR